MERFRAARKEFSVDSDEHALNLRRLEAFLALIADRFYFGSGTPEGSITASPGSLYLNLSGGAGTSLYIKESGTASTGWVAK